jgi:hypothetical protein
MPHSNGVSFSAVIRLGPRNIAAHKSSPEKPRASKMVMPAGM